MKHFKTRFLALCGLMVLTAAVLAPIVAEAVCPRVQVECPGGIVRSCPGTADGDGHCIYLESCLNCGGHS
jgi:hypothetical protein